MIVSRVAKAFPSEFNDVAQVASGGLQYISDFSSMASSVAEHSLGAPMVLSLWYPGVVELAFHKFRVLL